MLFCQFSKPNSLRDIHYSLNSATGNLNHYGVRKSPSKSSLSCINEHRDWRLFRDFYLTVVKNLNLSRNDKGRLKLKRKIFLPDSTIISLFLEIFDWAKYRAKKGAIKLHTVLDYDGCLPVFVEMTNRLKHDAAMAKQFVFPVQSVVIGDRVHLDFPLINQWDEQDVFFVIRCKENVKFIEEEIRNPDYENIQADIIGELDPSYKKYQNKLRMVAVYDKETEQYIECINGITVNAPPKVSKPPLRPVKKIESGEVWLMPELEICDEAMVYSLKISGVNNMTQATIKAIPMNDVKISLSFIHKT